MTNEISKRITQKIKFIRIKPQMMFVGIIDFERLMEFFYGYLEGISESCEINLQENFSIWINKKLNRDSSLFWTEHIRSLVIGKSEIEKQNFLFEMLNEYSTSL